jgi:hypothetical protein
MRKLSILTFVFLCVLLFSVSVKATTVLGTINMNENGLGACGKVGFWASTNDTYSPSNEYSYEIRQSDVYCGVYNFLKISGTGEADLIPDGFGAVCVDVGQYRRNGTFNIIMPEEAPDQNSYPGGPIGTAKADLLSKLWGMAFDDAWLGNYSSQSDINKKNAEAFGFAVWEIVNERSGVYDVANGSFMVAPTWDGKQLDLGNSNVNQLIMDAVNYTGAKADLRVVTNACGQDFLVEVEGGEIPEPGALFMTLAGVFGILTLVRKRRA